MDNNFKCANCQAEVKAAGNIGTKNRNHCPVCLFSKHVDQNISGDRSSTCLGLMAPIGLTYKHEGKGKQGELMLIHSCDQCDKISVNRIAGDDDPEIILKIFEKSLGLDDKTKQNIKNQDIYLLNLKDKPEILTQLYGKKI